MKRAATMLALVAAACALAAVAAIGSSSGARQRRPPYRPFSGEGRARAKARPTQAGTGPGAGSATRAAQSNSRAARSSVRASEATAAEIQAASLPRRELAGARVIYSYRGLRPPASLIARIKAGEAAGVIFFRENIAGAAQLRAVIDRLQRAAATAAVKAPLLMMTDQEGGLVRRLPGAPLLSETQIAKRPKPLIAARAAGDHAALNLRKVGMNVNLAPVLAVYRSSGGFIERDERSYSNNPKTVAQLGAGFIAAQQRAGVAATAKHFPGLGAASATQDTDERPVTLDVPLATLRSTDERPYRSAIAAGVKLVMLSWAEYPALDPGRPAGLSARIISGELRRRLHFEGVTITDALEAGALRRFGTISDRAVLAARAGMDLLLCSARDVSEGATAVDALARGLSRGQLSSRAFVESAARVIALRRSLKPG